MPGDNNTAQMTKPGNKGIKRLLAAFRFSWLGFKAAWHQEEAFRQECMLGLIMIPAAFWLGQTTIERLLLVLTCLFVFSAEIVNTAIESVVDRIGEEIHPLSGQAKDLGSLLVLISLTALLLTWGLIGWERFKGF